MSGIRDFAHVYSLLKEGKKIINPDKGLILVLDEKEKMVYAMTESGTLAGSGRPFNPSEWEII
jgi:hypothetical protein